MGYDVQENLQQSHLTLIGVGGLGCSLIPFLAGAGFGHITLIDGDDVAEHNLHRQTLFTPDDIGCNKALNSLSLFKKTLIRFL